MSTPDHFHMAEGYGCYRPVGQVSLQEAIDMVTTMIAYAHEHQIDRLLVDTTRLTGFGPPNIFERF